VGLVYLDPPFYFAQNCSGFFRGTPRTHYPFIVTTNANRIKANRISKYTRTRHASRNIQHPLLNMHDKPAGISGLQLRSVKALIYGTGIERFTRAAGRNDSFKRAPETRKQHGEQEQPEL
jgi:hypothetical protein